MLMAKERVFGMYSHTLHLREKRVQGMTRIRVTTYGRLTLKIWNCLEFSFTGSNFSTLDSFLCVPLLVLWSDTITKRTIASNSRENRKTTLMGISKPRAENIFIIGIGTSDHKSKSMLEFKLQTGYLTLKYKKNFCKNSFHTSKTISIV